MGHQSPLRDCQTKRRYFCPIHARGPSNQTKPICCIARRRFRQRANAQSSSGAYGREPFLRIPNRDLFLSCGLRRSDYRARKGSGRPGRQSWYRSGGADSGRNWVDLAGIKRDPAALAQEAVLIRVLTPPPSLSSRNFIRISCRRSNPSGLGTSREFTSGKSVAKGQ